MFSITPLKHGYDKINYHRSPFFQRLAFTDCAMQSGRYSARSASTGDMEAARVAGMMAAMNPLSASASAATESESGSQVETPYNSAAIRRPVPTESGTPAARPRSTRLD